MTQIKREAVRQGSAAPDGLAGTGSFITRLPTGLGLIRSLTSVRSCRTENRARASSGVDASEHRAAALAVETAPGRPGSNRGKRARPRPKLPNAWARPLRDRMPAVCPEEPCEAQAQSQRECGRSGAGRRRPLLCADAARGPTVRPQPRTWRPKARALALRPAPGALVQRDRPAFRPSVLGNQPPG